MSRATNTDCDMCGELLLGNKGVHWIDKPHIMLKGSMLTQRQSGDFSYVTRNPEDEMHFCDFDCLKGFADMRQQRLDDIQKKKRRQDALSATVYHTRA